MKTVITYGTFDLFHYGHLKLLERAKQLGDYLIVAVTSDEFDFRRGKTNNHQSVLERIQNVKNTGLADKIIIEEYEGQKIDDIKKYNVDIFTVGSDWVGKFDYLNEYCKVVYLERTKGISSTELREKISQTYFSLYGTNHLKEKFLYHAAKLDCIHIKDDADNCYIFSNPKYHYEQIKEALNSNKNVICESPICLDPKKCEELFSLARKNNLKLFDAIKTAYSTGFNRAVLLAKNGYIGDIVAIDSTCTSLEDFMDGIGEEKVGSLEDWGPLALFPVFKMCGVDYNSCQISTKFKDGKDIFTHLLITYKNCLCNVKVGKGAKSEGSLVITGTKGYIYIPSPWWKTEYFEVRFENQTKNEKYFFKLEGEGIREEISSFIRNINNVSNEVSLAICKIMEQFENKEYNELL